MEYTNRSDEALLKLIAQRDADALEVLYNRHAQVAFNLISRIVRDRALAEELLQETFWQVWSRAGDYRGEGAVAAWLYRIARNKSLDLLRRQQARPRPLVTDSDEGEQKVWTTVIAEDTAERVTARRWDREAVQQALATIPEEQRHCLELAYFEGMSQREIAEHTQTPLGTIKTRVRSGLQKLEYALRAAGFGPHNAS